MKNKLILLTVLAFAAIPIQSFGMGAARSFIARCASYLEHPVVLAAGVGIIGGLQAARCTAQEPTVHMPGVHQMVYTQCRDVELRVTPNRYPYAMPYDKHYKVDPINAKIYIPKDFLYALELGQLDVCFGAMTASLTDTGVLAVLGHELDHILHATKDLLVRRSDRPKIEQRCDRHGIKLACQSKNPEKLKEYTEALISAFEYMFIKEWSSFAEEDAFSINKAEELWYSPGSETHPARAVRVAALRKIAHEYGQGNENPEGMTCYFDRREDHPD